MSLSASEQQALDSIEATLTSSDPKLASLLAIFAQLVSGEEMPVRERVRIHRLQVTRGRQRKQRCSRLYKAGRHMRSGFRSLSWRRAALMMCLLAFAGLITVSVINSHANHEKCAHVRIAACVGHAQKAPSRAGSAGLRGLLEPAVLRVSDGRCAVKLNTRQGIDARLATLTTLAKAGQASWCSGEDWIQGGA
jgi:hypothetical protein